MPYSSLCVKCFLLFLLCLHISNSLLSLHSNIHRLIPSLYRVQASTAPIFDNSWYEMNGCLVLLPKNDVIPRSIIHFIGGFLVGNAPSIGYNYLLQDLAEKGHLIVASPVPISINHQEIADNIQSSFYKCYTKDLLQILGPSQSNVPVIGLSHSLGGKLRVLIEAKRSSNLCIPTCANIFLAFNNYDAKQSLEIMGTILSSVSPDLKKVVESIQSPDVKRMLSLKNMNPIPTLKNAIGSRISSAKPFDTANDGIGDKSSASTNTFESVAGLFTDILSDSINDLLGDVDERIKGLFDDYEFTPSAAKTWTVFDETYKNPSNIVFQFEDDEIDQSNDLVMHLSSSSFTPLLLNVKGNHVTPCAVGPDSVATTELTRLLGLQLSRLSDDNWGLSVARGGGRYILPSGKVNGGWDSDDV